MYQEGPRWFHGSQNSLLRPCTWHSSDLREKAPPQEKTPVLMALAWAVGQLCDETLPAWPRWECASWGSPLVWSKAVTIDPKSRPGRSPGTLAVWLSQRTPPPNPAGEVLANSLPMPLAFQLSKALKIDTNANNTDWKISEQAKRQGRNPEFSSANTIRST